MLEKAFLSFFKNFCEKQLFHTNPHIAKTSIIPKDYQGFGAPRCPEIQNFDDFHDFHEFP